MSRTTITLPDVVVDDLQEFKPEEMSWPAFHDEVVLPALAGEHVDIHVDGALEADVHDRLDDVEGRIDDLAAELPEKAAERIRRELR